MPRFLERITTLLAAIMGLSAAMPELFAGATRLF